MSSNEDQETNGTAFMNAEWSHKVIAIISAMLVVIITIGSVYLFFDQRSFAREPMTPFTQANKVTLPNYYKENMVFQQGKTITIQGKTSPNGTLTATLQSKTEQSSQTSSADDKGRFEIALPAPPAQLKAYTFTISSGNKVLRQIKHAYVGNVFLAAGQSNMEVNYYDYYNTESEERANLGNAADVTDLPAPINDTHVYFLVTDHQSSEQTQDNLPLREYNSNSWLPANTVNADYLGYLPQYFAEQLRSNSPKIPIGIIQTAWGGTEIARHMAGGDIYNNHVAPLKMFNIAGILWYQGEQDGMSDDMALAYQYNFSTLIKQYRRLFDNSQLPFLYVQLARFPGNDDWAKVRQAQFVVAANVDGKDSTAMTVSLDTDKGTNGIIHPLGKEILAQRMASQWKAINNNRTVPSGPLAQKAVSRHRGQVAEITFREDTANGLNVRRPNYSKNATSKNLSRATDEPLTGFEVAGSDGVYHSAEAVIQDDTISVFSDAVDDIRQVRYLWSANPECDTLLYNSYHLPASPFTLSVLNDES
ncbi:sialate O-acetylesterase [Bifidobacterium callitrichos]|uniref:Sialate O-acetylesterase n=3 Tax=Bifidobacterium TaxID=1678 RepID=A0A2T3G8Q1_9BIFI|nr:sialate O-acetylesterase [Bifidobacterium callitrichos]